MSDGRDMWPLEEAPVNVLLALSTERMEAANMAAASVAASFADQHPQEEEDFALERCFPETVQAAAPEEPGPA
eukprot:12801675-Alexandrium_andersonii.AAC.1